MAGLVLRLSIERHERQFYAGKSSCSSNSVVTSAPPEIGRISALPVPLWIIAPSRCVIPAIPALFAVPALDVIPARIPLGRFPPGIPRPSIFGAVGALAPVARCARFAIAIVARWAVVGTATGIGALARKQPILRVKDFSLCIHPEAFRHRFPAAALDFARVEVDGLARELALGLGRRRGERGSRRDISPYRLDHRLKDWHGDVAAGGAAAKGTALAVGVV